MGNTEFDQIYAWIIVFIYKIVKVFKYLFGHFLINLVVIHLRTKAYKLCHRPAFTIIIEHSDSQWLFPIIEYVKISSMYVWMNIFGKVLCLGFAWQTASIRQKEPWAWRCCCTSVSQSCNGSRTSGSLIDPKYTSQCILANQIFTLSSSCERIPDVRCTQFVERNYACPRVSNVCVSISHMA